MGKLIVLEGTDGSGKSTQFNLLREALTNRGIDFRSVKFPRYDNPSSAPIRMYLNGDFGRNPESVNPYVASTFYAVDRFASYRQDWEKYYKDGGLMLMDRYTTSNAVHQASKINDPYQRRKFLSWLNDFEYTKMELPKPDLVIYLDVPTDFTDAMMRSREASTNTSADIHEQDMEYLAHCRIAGRAVASFNFWDVVNCVSNGEMRSIEDIHTEIIGIVDRFLETGDTNRTDCESAIPGNPTAASLLNRLREEGIYV